VKNAQKTEAQQAQKHEDMPGMQTNSPPQSCIVSIQDCGSLPIPFAD
jgi:hypothetical protein